jgi:hypothetical protein
MTAKQIDIDGREESLDVTGTDFEKSTKQTFITYGQCYNLGQGIAGLRSYLCAIETPSHIMALFNDYKWYEFYQQVNLFAPYRASYSGERPERILLSDAPLKKIDGPGKTEIFVIFRDLQKSFRVECKYQKSSGTAEDKVYKSVLDLQKCGSRESLLIFGGDGFKPATILGIKELTAEDNFIIERNQLHTKCRIDVIKENELPEYIDGLNKRRISTGQGSLSTHP